MKFPINVKLNNNKLTGFPKNSHEVSKLVKFCNKKNINVIAIGGETNRVGGTNPYKNNKNIFFTYSKWEKESDLENYRTSDIFRSVWATTKPMFRSNAKAWSIDTLYSLK